MLLACSSSSVTSTHAGGESGPTDTSGTVKAARSRSQERSRRSCERAPPGSGRRPDREIVERECARHALAVRPEVDAPVDDRRVRDDAARAENEIEARRERDQNAHVSHQVAIASAVLGEVAYAAYDGPKCRSYPSVFAGVTNTVCTP